MNNRDKGVALAVFGIELVVGVAPSAGDWPVSADMTTERLTPK